MKTGSILGYSPPVSHMSVCAYAYTCVRVCVILQNQNCIILKYAFTLSYIL